MFPTRSLACVVPMFVFLAVPCPARAAGAEAAAAIPRADATAREICTRSIAGAPPGATITVPITVNDGLGVASFQIDVGFNPSLMTPLPARLGADTTAAGNWVVDSQVVSAGVFRVLAYNSRSIGLAAGFEQVALVDFLIGPGGAAGDNPLPLTSCILGDSGANSMPCVTCILPGVTGAAPRFAQSAVDDTLHFQPDHQVVEQGDWVVWRNLGAVQSHTSTSGAACAPDGLWRGALPPGAQFARAFPEAPGTLAYFCETHCASGETGTVTVTPHILLMVSGNADALLSWTGGGGLYSVFRSPNPGFTGPVTSQFDPDGGPAGLSLADVATPAVGSAVYYLVTNSH